MNLSSKIESILFYKGEAMSIKQLADILSENEETIVKALFDLKNSLGERGICLIKNEKRVMLGTAPEMHKIIEGMKKEELSKDLGKAGLETLSIILYQGLVRKSEIDYIRGVNSASILRNLMIRGLIERKNDIKNQRSFLYSPTLELLSFMGISDLEELPEYEKVKKEIEIVQEQEKDDEGEEKPQDKNE